jgi:hypothetical protein
MPWRAPAVTSEEATAPRSPVKFTLLANLIRGVARRGRVELFPARFAIGRPAIMNVDGGTIKNCFALCAIRVGNPRGHQGATPSNSLRVDMGLPC